MLPGMRGGALAAVAALALIVVASPAPAQAAQICWAESAPATGGEWNTPENWKDGAVPGASDTAIFNATGAGCSSPADVLISGAAAEVQLVRQATTDIVVDGTSLWLTGNTDKDLLGNVHARNGGSLTIAGGASIMAGGQITLGNPGGGTLTIDGTLRAVTGALTITDEPLGEGSVTISANGNLVYEPGNTGELRALFANDGAVTLNGDSSLGSQLAIHPSAGSPENTGSFAIGDRSTLTLKPIRGSAMVTSGSIAGSGDLEIDSSAGPPGLGTLSVPATATLAVGQLTIGPTSALDLGANASAGQLVMTQAAERRGAGTLTAGAANLGGGVIAGGTTKITGAATITGDTVNPTIRGGATLRTEGATTWSGGSVTLGGMGTAGTWENAGTLTINNADTGDDDPELKLASGDPAGVLKNLTGATINRGSPAGTMFGTGRIENAGTVNVQAGTMGEPAPGAAGAFVQSAGTTTISADATLSMNTTLGGGTLRGAGIVRSLVNSGGTVAPGLSPGTLTVAEDFTQGPGGTLAEEIAGPLAAQFDRLIVGGAASLAGTLAISSDPGYAPAPQSIHRLLTAASVTGTFAALTGAAVGDSAYAGDYLADGMRLCFAGCVAPPLMHKLSVTLSGSGSGAVYSDIGEIVCGTDCERTFSPGTVVELTASPASGSAFVSWSQPCNGTAACVVTMDQARAVTATFATVSDQPSTAQPSTAQPPPATQQQNTASTGKTAKAKLSAKDVLFLPSAKRCVANGRLSVRVRVPAGTTARRATVVIRGRQRKVASGAALARSFVSRAPRSGPFTAKLTLTLADGRSVSASGRYKACGARR
jgi:hypothetical protein